SILVTGLPPGHYQATVVTDSQDEIYEFDANGHADAEQNNTAQTTFDDTLDLQVSSVSLTPTSGVQSGGALTVNWTDANTGNKATGAGWYDRIVVVNTSTGKTVLDTTSYYDPAVTGNGNFIVGDHRDRSATFKLPDGPAGVGDIQAT